MPNLTARLKGAVRDRLMPPMHENVDYNRAMWDRMAKKWSPERAPVQGNRTDDDRIEVLGDEWGDPTSVEQILERFVYPHVDSDDVAGEIGSGGGRVALRVAPKVERFTCFDISTEMLRHARQNLTSLGNVDFVVLEGAQLPASATGQFDFLYAFDVFVHLDLHTQWKYFKEFSRVLKPGGKVMVHTSNLLTEVGWQQFASQDRFEIRGHYFVTPELVRTLISRAGLRLVDESSEEDSNFYYRRDYVAVAEKPST
jgi:SAM-dependent methyltransferase